MDASAKEALAAAMQKDFNDEVRCEAARALGSLRAKDQIPTLVAALEDPQNREHSDVRVEIIRTLGLIRDPAAGPALERALRDPNKQVVEEAILASAWSVMHRHARCSSKCSGPIATARSRTTRSNRSRCCAIPEVRRCSNRFWQQRRLLSRTRGRRPGAGEYDAHGWKTRILQEKKPNVRNALAFGLASSGELNYINDLANALDSRQEYQVEVYLYELGKFDGKLNDLYRYLRSTNPKVRAGMARVIGNIGDPASADQVRPLTDDPDTEVVREAVAALRKLSR